MDAPEMEDIWKELAPRKRRRRRKRKGVPRGENVPPEVSELLGEANMFFAFEELDKARERLLEAIRLCPAQPDAYHTLGLIYEEDGAPAKALEFYIIAAHLTPRDPDQWRHLAELSRTHNKQTQAIYCLNRALKTRVSPELLWEKQQLLVETGQPKKAVETLVLLLRKLSPDEQGKRTEACKELARLHHQLGQTALAVATLEDWHAARNAGPAGQSGLEERDLEALNILAECLVREGRAARCLALVSEVRAALGDAEEPIDLSVKSLAPTTDLTPLPAEWLQGRAGPLPGTASVA